MKYWNLKSKIIKIDMGKIVTKIKLSSKAEFKSESIIRNNISFNVNKRNDSSRRICSLYTPNNARSKCVSVKCVKQNFLSLQKYIR